jgi:drug/metabolite transporter (DMT)-like permease
MPPGLGLGLFASFAWGVVDVGAAIATRLVGSLRVLVGSQLVSLVVLVGIAALVPSLLGPTPVQGIVTAFPLGLLAAGAYLAYFTALRLGPLSIVSPVIVAYGGATVVLAVVFRGETLTTAQAAGAAVATAGVVLAGVTFEAGSLRGMRIVGPGVLAAVLTLVGFAVLTLLLAVPIREYGWLPAVIGSRIGNNLASILLLVVALRWGTRRLGPLLEPMTGWSRTAVAATIVTGLFDVVAFVAYAIGLEVAPVWLVGLASSFGPVLAVGYAIWRLGERPHRTQWAGLALIALGVVVLAVSG